MILGATPDIELLLAGRIPAGCVIVGKTPFDQIPAFLGNARIGLDVHPWLGEHLRVALPVKVCEYMAAGCAVVTSSMPVLDALLRESGADQGTVTLIDGGEPEEYAAGAARMAADIDAGRDPGSRARDLAWRSMSFGPQGENSETSICLFWGANARADHQCRRLRLHGRRDPRHRRVRRFRDGPQPFPRTSIFTTLRACRLLKRHPALSVGCHLNPITGRPLLPADRVPSLVDGDGYFHYRGFARKLSDGHIRMKELRAELLAQIDRTRDLAGEAFSHVDFHQGLHRLPRLYPLFLDVAEASGVGRIRTHRYRLGMESPQPRLRHIRYLLGGPGRIPRYLYNSWLRARAKSRKLQMPDRWIAITHMESRPDTLTLENYLAMLRNVPPGVSEFVAHPGRVDDELRRWSNYVEPREREREILLEPRFRDAIVEAGLTLAGYRDIPVSVVATAPHALRGAER